jgi:hypothetical protein
MPSRWTSGVHRIRLARAHRSALTAIADDREVMVVDPAIGPSSPSR